MAYDHRGYEQSRPRIRTVHLRVFLTAALAVAWVGCGSPTGPPEPPPPTPPPPPPGPVPTIRLRTLAAGSFVTCAVSTDTRTYCWGSNRYGELGTSLVPLETSVPSLVEGGHTFVYLTLSVVNSLAGPAMTCGLKISGEAFCWGSTDEGPLEGMANDRCFGRAPFDSPPVPCSMTPLPIGGSLRFSTLAAGTGGICGLAGDATAHCWGRNEVGQLGNGGHLPASAPTTVQGNHRFTRIVVGDRHTCGIATGGVAYCWGANGLGQLGNGNTNSSPVPVEVMTGVRFQEIAAGTSSTCALSLEGEIFCWGRGPITSALVEPPFIQGTTIVPVPTPLQGGLRFATLTMGLSHACGLATDGRAYCWGSNDNFQGGRTPSLSCTTPDNCGPALIDSNLLFASLEAGAIHTCGRTLSGEFYCWGSNISGELGAITENPAVPEPRHVIFP